MGDEVVCEEFDGDEHRMNEFVSDFVEYLELAEDKHA